MIVKDSVSMRVLAIESSCDESAMCVMEIADGQIRIISNLVATHDMLSYKGVVPEVAARQHLHMLPKMLQQIKHLLPSVSFIAATCEPGLMGGLIMGMCVGKSLAVALNKPFYAVDHIKAHALSPLIENPQIKFPYICLLVSGGHTMLIKVQNFNDMQVLGRTKDDAMGELFDKIGVQLDLGFPAGPKIEKYALKGDSSRFKLPVPKIKNNQWDFSFSGLKTAFSKIIKENVNDQSSQSSHVNNQAFQNSQADDQADQIRYDIAASLQDVVKRVCMEKLILCFEYHPDVQYYAVCGGVASNLYIRQNMLEVAQKYGKNMYFPSHSLCTDNAAMIAFTALFGDKIDDLNASVKSSLRW